MVFDLIEQVAAELEWTNPAVIKKFKGPEADRSVAKHPFYDRESLVMVGEHVTIEAGTGCVHTAPGHGEDDFYIAKKYGIEALCPVDERGDRKSTRLNSSHVATSYAVFCLKKKT